MNGAALFFNGLGLIIFVTFTLGLYKLFEKAGEAGWKAIVPVYNWIVWLRLIGKPVWWVGLIFLPVVGVLVLVSMVIDLARAFGQHDLKHHAAALLLPFYFFPKIGFDPAVTYEGPPLDPKKQPKKSSMREWGDAILFAGVSALIIRTFFVEAFMIPTSSMERTLMAGDFLFVSKFHYGARMPMTPLAVPFVHNKIKIGNFSSPSYLGFLELPYFRLPGLTKVKRNDIVVFNFPAHDIQDLGDGAGTVEPVSMKENYIKRCVAMPGDTLQLKNQQIYINGQPGENPDLMQYQYLVEVAEGKSFVRRKRVPGESALEYSFPQMEELGFRPLMVSASRTRPTILTENRNWDIARYPELFTLFMPPSMAEKVEEMPAVQKVEPVAESPEAESQRPIYPQHNNLSGQTFRHNIDNYGPIVIPAKGMTVTLTPKNLSLYWRVMTAYEHHEVEEKGGKVYVDGQETSTYTFAMNHYWMMGDNRHNSEDSRFFGFVPENHIVGKPLFVFFSYEEAFGIRWNRIGTKYVH
jgi:signal peptidase I